MIDKSNFEAKFYKSVCLLDAGNVVEAINELKEILQLSP